VYIDHALVNRGEGGWKSFVQKRVVELRDALCERGTIQFNLLTRNPVSNAEKETIATDLVKMLCVMEVITLMLLLFAACTWLLN
jgi:hypothetical protein